MLLNMGSCGLHTIHNAYKAGIKSTEWDVVEFLALSYRLFKDCPARQDDFKKSSGKSIFPIKFVQHRWLENISVIQRCLFILNRF